jgi:V/A-type H+/Na+-transporting ATPase subunit A
MVLLGGRLLREAVLQQSALSENDAYCEPAKQSALLTLVLDVVDACRQLVESGVAASAVEELDFSRVTRARDETPPDAAAEVAGVFAEITAKLRGLA